VVGWGTRTNQEAAALDVFHFRVGVRAAE
jgi:hypothetical protein